jgi:hypothetical protein
MFMRHVAIVSMAGLLLCTLSGCVVHNSLQEQAPMWWPAFMVQQNQTTDQWGGQDIYGRSCHAKSNMQALPSVPAQPEL